MADTELLIAGGSFAGLCCAKAAAARGVVTVLLEKQSQAGTRVHTTGLLVKEVADAWDVPRSLTRKIPGVRLYTPGLASLDFQSPGYYFLATDTGGLLRWLERQAMEAGTTIIHNARVTSQTWGAKPALRAEVDGQDQTFGFRFLVGCDGARSKVARAFGLGCNREFLRGVEFEFAGVVGLDQDYLHVFVDSELAPGYIAWVVPGVGGVTQVGLAVRPPAVPSMDALVNKLSQIMDLTKATVVGRRGGLIPCGGLVSPLTRDNVMLLGDAAGMVSPLTAGGIHSAMDIGRAAGVSLSAHLLDGEPDFMRQFKRQLPSFFYKKMLRRAFDVPLPNAALERLIDSKLTRALAQNIFFHHRGLFSAKAWRDMLWNDQGRETLFG